MMLNVVRAMRIASTQHLEIAVQLKVQQACLDLHCCWRPRACLPAGKLWGFQPMVAPFVGVTELDSAEDADYTHHGASGGPCSP